ncbi:MAG: type VI secretion system baseplate subunit TssE [Acidobacteria bacterium]|nr:MAG: type VI secretion system baseplate subunit TssE [Acidobacteriota bacterium]
MRDPKPIEGGRALLFERLTDESPRSLEGEARPFRVHEREELKESVRRELARLLNTRCSVPSHLLGSEERTVLDYGIPDFSALSALSGDDQNRLASIVAQTVAAFEPRLRDVRVRVERVRSDDRALVLRVEAALAVGTHAEPVSFPVLVRTKTGETEVSENEGHEDEPA